MLKRMLIFDWVRGPDSTGVAVVRNDNEIHIAKVADNPFILLDTMRFQKALSANNSKVFMGHNRAATRGVINHQNTHPFEVDHIVGCHNGTLDYSCFEALKRELGENFTCDSHAVIAAIARWGLKAAIGRLTGSWSLVWYDSNDGTLNFLRNKERPMTYGYSKDMKRLFWASESVMIDAAARLTTGVDLFADSKGVTFWETEEDVHYRFDVEALKAGGKTVPKPKVAKVKGKETVNTGTNTSNFPNRAITRNSGTQKPTTGTGSQSTNTGTSSLRRDAPRYNGGREGVHQCVGHPLKPFNDFLDREEFAMLTHNGCSWCEEPVVYGECGIVIFERGPTVLCPTCSGKKRRNRFVLENRAAVPALPAVNYLGEKGVAA